MGYPNYEEEQKTEELEKAVLTPSAEYAEGQKTEDLEKAVLTLSAGEVAELYSRREMPLYAARALGFACRYRGFDMVKALVELGARFGQSPIRLKNARGYSQEIMPVDYSEALMRSNPILEKEGFYEFGDKYGLTVLALDERLRIFDHLCGIAEKVGLKPQSFMFWACLSCNPEMIERLKDRGTALSEDMIEVISREENALFEVFSRVIPDEEFIPYVTSLNSVLGGKKVRAKFYGVLDRLVQSDSAELIDFIFKNFNFGDRKQTDKLLKQLIGSCGLEKLALAAENGLLDGPEYLDGMIKYSAEQGSTACTAFLLDFKHRKFDGKNNA